MPTSASTGVQPVIATSTRPAAAPAEVQTSEARCAASPSIAGEPVTAGDPSQAAGDDEVDDGRHDHHGDGEVQVDEGGRARDQPATGLDRDDRARGEDEDPLHERRQVLGLLVAVGVVVVGRPGGGADPGVGDARGHEVAPELAASESTATDPVTRPTTSLASSSTRVGAHREQRGGAVGAGVVVHRGNGSDLACC